jgi:transcriptional regulator with XRE-family HTH domain
MMRLGAILKRARGKESRVQFARKLELSYTFVRAMEHGLRYPSDKVLMEIAERLGVDPEEMFLAAYCDRSPMLAQVLRDRGVTLPEGDGLPAAADAPAEVRAEMAPAAPVQPVKVHNPF